jgi:hypothetical protein
VSPEDRALVEGFASATLANESFHHREHVRVAWLYLCAAPFEEAAARFCRDLKRFAAAHGRPQLFHHTITWAFLALVKERQDVTAADDFDAFAAANPDLLAPARDALSPYYDRETLGSERARRVFLLPRR